MNWMNLNLLIEALAFCSFKGNRLHARTHAHMQVIDVMAANMRAVPGFDASDDTRNSPLRAWAGPDAGSLVLRVIQTTAGDVGAEGARRAIGIRSA